MNGARIRLIVAGLLLAGWFGYLGYLALAKEPPIVVPRSQLQNATHRVKAGIAIKPSGNGITVRVAHSQHALDGKELPETLIVENLQRAQLPNGRVFPEAVGGSGDYLLLLELTESNRFRIVAASAKGKDGANDSPVIYPWTSDVERQVREQLAP